MEERRYRIAATNADCFALQERLWDNLGPDKAPYASPTMLEGGEVKWHSFLPGDKGKEVEVYANIIDAFMSDVVRPGHYDD